MGSNNQALQQMLMQTQGGMLGGRTPFTAAQMDTIMKHHFNTLANNQGVSTNGGVATVHTIQVDINGRPTLIPSVWDGKIVSDQEAVARAKASGQIWPTANTHKELRAYDEKLHENIKLISSEAATRALGQGRR